MNSPQPRLSWSEAAQPRSWPLPIKLIAVVAVPALFAITLGTLRVLDQSDVAAEFDQVDRVAALQEEYSQLVVEVQDERDQAVQFVAVRERQNPAPFEVAAGDTDKARDEAVRLLGDQSDLNSGTVGALRQVDNSYFRLTQLRRQVLTGANDAADLVSQYNGVVEPLLVFDNALTRQLSNPEISGLSQAIGVLGEAREQVAVQQSLINSVLEAGTLADPQADALRAADSRLATATSTIRSVLSDEQQARYTAFAGSVAATREQLRQSVVDRGRAELPLEVAPQVWNDASAAVLKAIDDAETGARSELRDISAVQQDAASNQAGVSSVFLLLAILLGAGIVYLVAKALISSLRTLRTAALDVANRRLPEAVQSMRAGGVPDIDVAPVPVTTREEIGQVARAFDAVHGQAVRLAAEQATLQANVSSMFANLSRRSQALAERQLKLIEELESNEQDPDQLSNLFQLDSLATRMRRNSENLLVLSGTDLSKRTTQPVPVVDVLRAAVSEVEQYQRVVVQSPPEATIAGRAASDIVHLLAELVDNATNFSAPDTQVVMTSQRTPDGSVLIEIVDRGVGMGGDEIDDANQRLARPTALDVSVSRRMGLFVVGRLAARHGLVVRLGNPASGTTASVTVPSYLVTSAAGADFPGGAGGPIPAPTPAALPGREFMPAPRPASNGGDRPSPVGSAGGMPPSGPGGMTPVGTAGSTGRDRSLSALVAGADAPLGTPGGPVPFPSAGAAPPMNAVPATNGTEPHAEPSAPHGEQADELPTRRPGQLLGQPPAPTDTTFTPAPTSDQLRPGSQVPPTTTRSRPAPAAERSGSQPAHRPTPAPGRTPAPTSTAAMEPAPVTEAFPAQSPTPAAQAAAPLVQPVRPQPQRVERPEPGQPAPSLPSRENRPPPTRPAAPGRPSPQPGRPLPARRQPEVTYAAQGSAPTAPPRPSPQPAPTQQTAPPQPLADQQPVAPARPPLTGRVQEQPGTPLPARRLGPSAPPAVAGRTDSGAGGLFAPATAAARSEHDPGAEPPPGDGRSETTPIFEEIASAWFREDRPVPMPADAATSDDAPAPRLAAPAPVAPPAPPVPPATPSAPLPRRVSAPEPVLEQQPAPQQSSAAGVPAFSTAADDGWRASAAAADAAGDELTPAGLPKRRPRARLVPGAAAAPTTPAAVAPARTAESIRGRLSSYQDGVRQGREIRMRRAAAAANGRSSSDRDEENR